MSGPVLPRVESVPGQLVFETTVRDVLARAHFERFIRSTGLTGTWEAMGPRGRYDWGKPVAHLTTAVHGLVDRALELRRGGTTWIVGARDTTLAPNGDVPVLAWCGRGIDQWQCSREQGHPADVHAAGDGYVIAAVSAVTA